MTDIIRYQHLDIFNVYLKNGLAEKKEGEREGREEEGGEAGGPTEGGRRGKERENAEYNGKGKKMGNNTFLSLCLSTSVAKKSRSTKEKSLVLF